MDTLVFAILIILKNPWLIPAFTLVACGSFVAGAIYAQGQDMDFLAKLTRDAIKQLQKAK